MYNTRQMLYNTSIQLVLITYIHYIHSRKSYISKSNLMYRIINNICPDYLKNYISYTSDISCRHTRSTNCYQLYTPKPNCELFRKSFMNSGAAIWNYLPIHVKNETSVTTFKCLYLKWKRLNDH